MEAERLAAAHAGDDPDRLAEEEWEERQLEQWVALNLAFWRVPKVSFVVDALFKMLMLANQIVLLTGHFFIGCWMACDPWTRLPYYDPSWTPPMTHDWTRTMCEVISAVLAAARLVENVRNARMGSHSQSPFFFYVCMRVFDFLSCAVLVATFALRLFAALMFADDPGFLLAWSRTTQDVAAVATIFLTAAFLQVISYNRQLGQALTTLFEMIHGSLDVLLIILVVAAGFGVASPAPLLPSLFRFPPGNATAASPAALNASRGFNVTTGTYADGTVPVPSADAIPRFSTNDLFLMPLFLGLYAFLTLLDIGMYDDLALSPENEVSVAAFCLLLFSLFVTVFCMNLLIAKMASRYEGDQPHRLLLPPLSAHCPHQAL